MRLEFDVHDNDALIWTLPLTLAVAAAGTVLVGVAVLVPGVTLVGVLGAVALVVAGSGRLGSVLELRYGRTPLAQPIAVPHHGRARRRSTRRSSGVPWVVVGFGVLLLAVADRFLLIEAIGLAFIVFGLLVGPAAGFVVTPHHLHIDTAFRRTSVPRHLIGTFEHGDLDVRLRLLDGDFFDVRVDSPIMEYTSNGYWMNSRCRVRTVDKLVRMLREVPASADPARGVTHHRRRFVIAGAGIATVAILAMAAVGVMTDSGTGW